MSLPPPPASPTGTYTMPAERKSNGAAIASLICGILGCIPAITGLLAVILGIVGLKKTKDPRYGGKGLAITGLILGLLSLVGWGIFGSLFAAGWGVLSKATAPARLVAKPFITDVYNNQPAQAMALTTLPDTEVTSDATNLSKPNATVSDVTLIPAGITYENGTEFAQITAIVKRSDGSAGSCTVRVDKQADGSWKVSQFTGQ